VVGNTGEELHGACLNLNFRSCRVSLLPAAALHHFVRVRAERRSQGIRYVAAAEHILKHTEGIAVAGELHFLLSGERTSNRADIAERSSEAFGKASDETGGVDGVVGPHGQAFGTCRCDELFPWRDGETVADAIVDGAPDVLVGVIFA
jgi:hypothetical protein